MIVVHTHSNRSDSFFNDLQFSKPDVCLEIGSTADSLQTARIMECFETVILSKRPDAVLVVGDGNLDIGLCAGDQKDIVSRR